MSVLQVLYQQYGSAAQEDAVSAFRRIHAASFRDLELRILVVDNRVTEPTILTPAPDVTVIDGDNTFREFTAFDKGWRHLERDAALSNDSVVLIANETFLKDAEAADYFALPLDARAIIAKDKLIGHIDGLSEPVTVFGMNVQEWIRSDFILANAKVVGALMPFTVAEPDVKLFGRTPSTFFVERSDLSADYRAFIKGFLEGRANLSMWRWPQAKTIDESNLAAFQLKARAILSEHSLSARAVAQGFALHDLSPAQFPSKRLRHQLRALLYHTGLWRVIPRFRARFSPAS